MLHLQTHLKLGSVSGLISLFSRAMSVHPSPPFQRRSQIMFPKHSFGIVFGLVVDVFCTQVPPDDQEMERRFGFIFWILIQQFVHDAWSVASVRQSLHRAFSLKSLYSCGSCRYSDAYDCAQSPTQTAEMAILVCSTLSIFFYLTYFIKMHDSSATFMIILE